MPHIYSVKELTYSIKEVVEGEFPFVWVKGQIGDVSLATSGHLYFVLKDEEAILNVVWFKNNHFLHLNLPPKEIKSGLEVVCAGRIVVYPPKGTYQLIAELVQKVGIGDLHLQFEALKKKLYQKGYFDEKRKREIPISPSKVAVVTAPTGAAIKDFLYIASKRGWSSSIRIYPTLVQGDEAPESIAKAINLANEHRWAEVIVVIRGGGSLEDLWAFNTEIVADAIYNSQIPVLTGIGHEIDTTIADLTADKRVATPSHAAQILWPDRTVLIQQIDELEYALVKNWWSFYQKKEKELKNEERIFKFFSPIQKLKRKEEELKRFTLRFIRSLNEFFRSLEFNFKELSSSIFRLYPYRKWKEKEQELSLLKHRLSLNIKNFLLKREKLVELADKKLESLDPYKPLERGYSLVYVERTKELLRSKTQVCKGEKLRIRTKKDEILAEVTEDL